MPKKKVTKTKKTEISVPTDVANDSSTVLANKEAKREGTRFAEMEAQFVKIIGDGELDLAYMVLKKLRHEHRAVAE